MAYRGEHEGRGPMIPLNPEAVLINGDFLIAMARKRPNLPSNKLRREQALQRIHSGTERLEGKTTYGPTTILLSWESTETDAATPVVTIDMRGVRNVYVIGAGYGKAVSREIGQIPQSPPDRDRPFYCAPEPMYARGLVQKDLEYLRVLAWELAEQGDKFTYSFEEKPASQLSQADDVSQITGSLGELLS